MKPRLLTRPYTQLCFKRHAIERRKIHWKHKTWANSAPIVDLTLRVQLHDFNIIGWDLKLAGLSYETLGLRMSTLGHTRMLFSAFLYNENPLFIVNSFLFFCEFTLRMLHSKSPQPLKVTTGHDILPRCVPPICSQLASADHSRPRGPGFDEGWAITENAPMLPLPQLHSPSFLISLRDPAGDEWLHFLFAHG